MTSKPSIKLFAAIFIALSIINFAWIQSPYLGWIFLLPALLFSGMLAGSAFWPDVKSSERIFIGTGLVLCWIAVIGAAFFYLWRLGHLEIGVIAASLGLTILLPQKRRVEETEEIILAPSLGSAEGSLRLFALVLGYAALVAILARTLAVSGTADSIRTPWTEVPPQFFLVIFLTILALIGILLNNKSKHGFALGLPLLFLLFSVTVFVYPIGFGFDPFVHNAAEYHIAEYGAITPKPFSYIGQYSLVLFFHHLTGASIILTDRLLLPIFLIPFVIFALRRGLQNGFRLSPRAAALGALLLPILPFSGWILTTPQGLGNGFALFTISLVLASGFRISWPALLAAAAALVTHPMAGIPAFIMLGLAFFRDSPFKMKSAARYPLLAIFLAAAGIVLPALFLIYGRLAGLPLFKNFDASGIIGLFPKIIPELDAKYVFWDDLSGLYNELWIPLVLAVAVSAAIFLRIKKISTLLLAAVLTWINSALLLGFVDFSYLPLAEQSGYAERLFGVGILFLIPLILTGFVTFLWRAKTLSPILRIAAYSVIAGAITASVYLSYPHHDARNIARGWSVGEADLAAVHFINSDAGDREYIVLANQSVSAAALREFGFKRYYKICGADSCGESFYYPIPTSGPLYQYFHDASYGAPIRETILSAMDSAGVDLGYFVVNSYWWKADKLAERAKKEAAASWTFKNGAVHVFRFQKL